MAAAEEEPGTSGPPPPLDDAGRNVGDDVKGTRFKFKVRFLTN